MKTNTSLPPGERPSLARLLQEELARRCARNPQYSLRAFARTLDVDHSTLSQLLRGRRPFSEAMVQRLGRRLGLAPDAVAEHVAAERARAQGEPARREQHELHRDVVGVIGDWYHYAILELARTRAFRPDVRWIARVLGIETDEVAIAVQRLARLKLLRMEGEHWLDLTGPSVASFEDFTRAALERFLAQQHELRRRAREHSAAQERVHTTTTLAIYAARLPEVQRRIHAFHQELVAWLEQDETRDRVYQLDSSFFPLTLDQEQRPWASP